MNIEQVKQAKTQEEARQFAIEWRHWQSNVSMSWEEVMMWGLCFEELAAKFDLKEEFAENGII